MKFASVYVFDVLYSLDKIYEYYVPEELEDSVDVGSYVCVPFGNGNRKRQAVVFSVSSDCEYENPKPIHSVISENDRVSEEFLRLAEYMKDNTFCTISDALKTILPTSQMTSEKEYYYVFPDKEKDFENSKYTGKFDLIYSYIKTRGNVSVENLKKHFGADVVSSLGTLVNLGYLKKDRNFEKKKNIKTIDLYYTELSEEEIDSILSGKGNIKVKSAKQADVLRLLRDGEKYSAEEIKSRVGVGSSPVKALLENKIIKCEKTDVYKNPYSEMCETRTKDENILSEEQNAAYEKLLSLYKSHEPKGALLFGVTGSGKTRVIKSLIDAVVNEGRGVIVLVPEISLTPQTVGLFCSFYGDRVAVIHSGLSKGERYDTYRRIKNKEADIVIGTRSAVFAPLDNVGMIVIDEEQEHTYKSDTTPKYHARDIARFRCAKHSALMLLSSATPSIESFYKAGLNSPLILNTVNKLLSINTEDNFAALDVSVIDLNDLSADFIKYGSPYGFIIGENGVKIIEGSSLPLGIIEELKPTVCHTDLSDGDMLLFMTDGISDAFGSSGEVIDFLRTLPAKNPQTLANQVLEHALSLNSGQKKDDMTALAVRVYKRAVS